jgi:hypothetical protein
MKMAADEPKEIKSSLVSRSAIEKHKARLAEDRIKEIKRKAETAHSVYLCLDGVFKLHTIGVCLHDTFNVWRTEDGACVHMTIKYSDVSPSAKFFELTEVK